MNPIKMQLTFDIVTLNNFGYPAAKVKAAKGSSFATSMTFCKGL